MVGIYFSGTGNTRYCLERFLSEVCPSARCVSIEDANAAHEIRQNGTVILAYPIYFSNLPKIMRDFLMCNRAAFAGKKVFIIATMGLFSGDGAGCSARLLARCGARILGGLHLKMPDCIGDEKALKKTPEQNRRIVKAARAKIKAAARTFQAAAPTREGIGFLYHMAGLFGQRLWFYNKTRYDSDKLKIDPGKCTGCGACVKLCPKKNLRLEDGKARAAGTCTMCYRCVSHCPRQAVTLLGKTVYEQCKIENYIGRGR